MSETIRALLVSAAPHHVEPPAVEQLWRRSQRRTATQAGIGLVALATASVVGLTVAELPRATIVPDVAGQVAGPPVDLTRGALYVGEPGESQADTAERFAQLAFGWSSVDVAPSEVALDPNWFTAVGDGAAIALQVSPDDDGWHVTQVVDDRALRATRGSQRKAAHLPRLDQRSDGSQLILHNVDVDVEASYATAFVRSQHRTHVVHVSASDLVQQTIPLTGVVQEGPNKDIYSAVVVFKTADGRVISAVGGYY